MGYLMSEKSTGNGNNGKDTGINRRNYLKLAGAAGTGFGTGLGGSALGTGFTMPSRAASTIVDDFTYSSGGLSDRYKFDQDAGNATTTSASTVGSSDNDSTVLEISGDTSALHAFQGDDDTDLNAYPEIGDTFSCWVRGLNGTEIMNFSYGVQDANNKYYVQFNLDSAHLGLFKYVNGSGNSLAGDWSNSTIQNNTGWFKVEIQWTTDHQHTVTLYQDGSEVTSFSYTEGSDDPQFTANGVGFSGHMSSGETTQFDYATTTSESTSTGSIYDTIDDFEVPNRSLADVYDFDRGKDGASIVSDVDYSGLNALGPSYNGSHALKIDGTHTEMISRPGDGLPYYPSAGDSFSYWVMGSDGADRINCSYGVQDHANRYLVRVNFATDYLRLWRLEGNTAYTLEAQSASPAIEEDTWYYVDVEWRTDGTHHVSLYDTDDTELAELTYTESSPKWTDGGIGYDAYLADDGGTVYFDDVKIGDLSGRLPGWGVETMHTGDDWDDIHTSYRHAEDFNFAIVTGGGRSRNEFDDDNDGDYDRVTYTYNIVLGGKFSTYSYPDELEGEPPESFSPEDIKPHVAQAANRWSLEVQNTETAGHDYVNTNGSHMFTLNPELDNWRNWLDTSWDSVAGEREVRDRAIDANDQLSGDEPPWYYDLLKWGLGFIRYVNVPAAALDLIDIFGQESYCGRDDDNETNTSNYIQWDYCNGGTLTFHVAEVAITVPENETVNIVIEEEVAGEYDRENFHSDNVGQWTLEITGGDNKPEIIDRTTFSRNRIT